MGYVGKIDLKFKAIELRKKGLSYKQIKLRIPVSKDTLSRWCRDVVLSPEQLEILTNRKIVGSERGRILGAKTLQLKRINQIREMFQEGKKEVGSMSKRDVFIAGIALYLGEGYKTDKSIGFANSDPKIIEFMMSWFRNFCDIDEAKFTGQIWIHDDKNRFKAEKYWSDLTKIPLTRFSKTYIVENKTNSKKIRKNIHEYGVFSIRISDAKVQRRILGWTSGILEN